MQAPSLRPDLRVGLTEQRVDQSAFNVNGRPRPWPECSEPRAAVELQRLPGTQAFQDLLWKLGGVSRRAKGQRNELSRELVMPVTIRRCAAEDRIDDERAEHAYHPDHVADDFLLAPHAGGFLQRLGEPEVELPAEELLTAVQSPRLQQLLRANDSQGLEELGPDGILPAFPTREGKVPHAGVIAAGEPGHEQRVLVIRVRADDQHARRGLEAQDPVKDPGGAQAGDRANLGRRQARGNEEQEEDSRGACPGEGQRARL